MITIEDLVKQIEAAPARGAINDTRYYTWKVAADRLLDTYYAERTQDA